MSHIFVAKYLKQFNPKLVVFTLVPAKFVCDRKLWFIFLVSKISHIIVLDRLFFTLKSSIASSRILVILVIDRKNVSEIFKNARKVKFQAWQFTSRTPLDGCSRYKWLLLIKFKLCSFDV